MLLSPCSKFKKVKGYSCCESCFFAMRLSLKDKKPPKLSIANGFVIGEVPIIKYVDNNDNVQEFDIENYITEVMRALLSPTRTHGYVLDYS